MVYYVANFLKTLGYNVRADLAEWVAPKDIRGSLPDIIATLDSSGMDSLLIVEVETCSTYENEHTRQQLVVFSNFTMTYVIVPSVCYRDNQPFDPVPELKASLQEWGLHQVIVGTCDPYSGAVKLSV